ncbi:MAG: putative porin [Bacteroidia bacterium]
MRYKFISFTSELIFQRPIKTLIGSKYNVVLFLLVSFSVSFSQVYYSVNPDYLKVKYEGNNTLTNYSASYPDTAINDFHNFFPRNFMGNLGLPSPNYIFSYGTSDLGFRLYPTPYSNDRFSESQSGYYRSKGPYASLTGISGSKKLQALKLFFTQTYKNKINIAVRFNRYTSLGYYLKQQTYTNNFCLTSNYTRPDRRNGYYFYFINNGNKNQENGGIVGDTLSDIALHSNKDLLPVKLSGATRDNKEFKFMFNPWMRLNKGPDSSLTSHHYLQLKSKVNFNMYKYKDTRVQEDNFYTLMYLDTAHTYDSTRVMQAINELSYSFINSKRNVGFSAGYKNELNSVWQKQDSSFMNNFMLADLILKKSFFSNDSSKTQTGQIESRFNGQYIFNGANNGNYKVENRSVLSLSRKKLHQFSLDLMYENRSPDYIYNYWVSNNFTWFNNGYRPQQMFQSKFGYSLNKKIGISFLFQNIGNYLFFDNVAQPRQYAGQLQNLGVTVNYSVVLFKHLGFYLQDIYQSTSNNAYISAPGNIATARLFYTGSLYKNNLQLQVGAQIQYYQSFYGYAYMPASQVFYLQDRQTTGEYPYVDVYLNARIRPVNIFLKVENMLQGYAGSSYSFVPGYYQPDRAFRFGINWMFFD